MTSPASGRCLCGDFTYQFDRETVISAHHCHCKDCQKMTGSGKATIIMVPDTQLQLQGELKHFTVTGTDGSHVSRGFCPTCGSQALSRVEELPGITFVKAGTLDDAAWVTIDSTFWSESAMPWSPVDEAKPAFPGNPPAG